MLPKHGRVECRLCYGALEGAVRAPHPEWRMVNDPGAWGGGDAPEYLVLGFSKGSTQANIYATGRFEDVAFAGMRPRLTQALRAMGAIDAAVTSDQLISRPDSHVAFGSLIRCSVSRRDKTASNNAGRDVYGCTGPLITKSFAEIPDVISACAGQFLRDLPGSIRAVFMLGTTDAYVKSCQQLLRRLFPSSFAAVNEMAVRADNKLWVHIAHPSGLNGHFDPWLRSSEGPGRKRALAQQALKTISTGGQA